LFGPFFVGFFRGVNVGFSLCSKELHQCECEHFEDGQPPPTRNPEWWQQVTRLSEDAPQVDVSGWTKQLSNRAQLN
jgi:hypothetical protein